MTHNKREKIAILGSGNWGSAIAKIVGFNAARHAHFEDNVHMWVYEEMVDGRKVCVMAYHSIVHVNSYVLFFLS